MDGFLDSIQEIIFKQHTYLQVALIIAAVLVAQVVAATMKNRASLFRDIPQSDGSERSKQVIYQLRVLLFPLALVLVLQLSAELLPGFEGEDWLVVLAIAFALVYSYTKAVGVLVVNQLAAKALRLVGIPLLTLQLLGVLPYFTSVLEGIAVNVGNIHISLLGLLRVLIFGSFVFWLGRISNNSGKEAIRKQANLDFRTREVAAKLFEIGVFVVVSLVLLQIMGINLTALAVFGGALGVGLGFGLQSIASNFISGLIILLDRSLSIGDFIELEDGRSGYVTSLNMRSTNLETFEGKDIIVPNESFITGTFVNWTHKNQKQRYRVDFSVAYDTDIRKLVEVIKEAVASHPQVLSGEEYPIEERPDCEIDSFGDSGVNMFVEFWMEAVDDGKNRVGGDLLLIIFETMREHGFTIPFPQREVRILNEGSAEFRSGSKSAPDK